MKVLKRVFPVILAVAVNLGVIHPTEAGANLSKSAIIQKAEQYDRALVTPPHASNEQHHLIAATLAAHHSQGSDQSDIMQLLRELSAMVTYLAQSDTTFWWDGFQWIPSNRSTYTYSGTKLTEEITQSSGDGIDWVNETRLVNVYDGGGRLTSMTTYTWSGSWVNETMTTFTYDGSGNAITSLSQSWGGSAWVNEFQSEMTYSGSNIATITTQIWNGAWVNMRKDIYSYGAFGVTEILTQSWTGSWNDAERIVMSYDGSGRSTQWLWQLWRNNTWRNWFKDDYTYDGSTTNQILDVRSDWDTVGSDWVEGWADTSRYASGQLIEMVTAYFTFPFVTRFLYDYDGNGNLVEEINQNGPGPTWMNFSRTVTVYITAGIFDDDAYTGQLLEFDIGQNYPNPFNLSTVIPYSLSGDGHVKITVCNILGQTMSTLVDEFQPAGPHTALWNGRDVNGREAASGIYFTRVQVGSYSQVRKMVLLK
jgi:hypothetical protein